MNDKIDQLKIMKVLSKYNIFDGSVQWTEKFDFFALCNDLFYWACADAETVTLENLPVLEKALQDTNSELGVILFCCRVRKMRPQGAYYAYIDEKYCHLFDECGPDRDKEPGNTQKPKVKKINKETVNEILISDIKFDVSKTKNINSVDDIFEIMSFMVKHYCFDGEVVWDENLNFGVTYEDLFSPNDEGCIALDITTLPDFQAAIDDTDDCFGFLLYCCRQVKKTPYKGSYKAQGISDSYIPIFEKSVL